MQGCNNMDSDLSPQDKKDLDKFIKFFALKVSRCFKIKDNDFILGSFKINWTFLDCVQQQFHYIVDVFVDCSGDSPGSPRWEDMYSLVFNANWLWLGKAKVFYLFIFLGAQI